MSEPNRPAAPVKTAASPVTDERGAPIMPETPTPASRPASGTDTVTVACKWPPGVILQPQVQVEEQEPYPNGMRTVKVWRYTGSRFVVRGPVVNVGAYKHVGELPEGIVGGFKLNPGCPREVWETWLKQNQDSDLVRNGLIFAHSDYNYASDSARERREVLSGAEPIDQSKPWLKNPADLRGIERGEHAPGARGA